MTIEELKDSGAIYFEKITEGMQQYDNQIVRMNEYQAVDKFTELWEACGCKNVYVDFYYFTLPQEAREQIDSVLAYQEREYVHQMEHKEGQVLFQANEILFSICSRLNAAEIIPPPAALIHRKMAWQCRSEPLRSDPFPSVYTVH